MRYITLFLVGIVHWTFAQTVENENVTLSYLSEGEGDTTLLFIHGWAIDQTYWQPQVDYFKDNYRVVTLDLAGHGESSDQREDWTMEAFGDDVVTVIQALDLRKIVMIGHSMGGTVMLEAASQVPDRIIGLVGVDNFKDVGAQLTEEQQQEYDMFTGMMETNFGEVVDSYVRGMLFTPESNSVLVDSVAQDMRSAKQDMARSSLINLMESTDREIELLQTAPVKLYLIQSEALPTQEEPLKEHTQYGYEIRSVGKVSHYPMLEVPELFNEQLEEVLASIAEGDEQ